MSKRLTQTQQIIYQSELEFKDDELWYDIEQIDRRDNFARLTSSAAMNAAIE